MVEHKYSKRDNANLREIRGYPMYTCTCGKRYQTKGMAEAHCRKENEKNAT